MLTPKGKEVLRQISNKYRFPVNRKLESHYYLMAQILEYEKSGNEKVLRDLRREYIENKLIETWQMAVNNNLINRAS